MARTGRHLRRGGRGSARSGAPARAPGAGADRISAHRRPRPPPVFIAREPIFEAIVRRLREDILRGMYPPETPLRLQELADRFGTSLMPVREALHRLAAEGLLTTHARRGATVAAFDPAEALEISELRQLLMARAARLAVPRLTGADLRELEQITRSIDALLAADPLRLDRYLELNDRFHALLCERSGNRHLARLVRSFDALGRVAMYRFFHSSRDLGRFNDEHRQILAALEARDADRVERLIAEHFGRSAERIRALASAAV